jgi:hypothetical protein
MRWSQLSQPPARNRSSYPVIVCRRHCITLGQWPFVSESEARKTAELLRAGDWRTVSRIMLQYGKLELFESRVVEKMGESGIEAAIERERSWMRTARVQYWPRLGKVEARRALESLESLLGRVRAFAKREVSSYSRPLAMGSCAPLLRIATERPGTPAGSLEVIDREENYCAEMAK